MNWNDLTKHKYPDNGQIVLVRNINGVHMAEYSPRTMGDFGLLAHMFSYNNEVIHGVTHWLEIPSLEK